MRTRWSSGLAIAGIALMSLGAVKAGDDATAKEKDELKKLQGVWTVEAIYSSRAGREMPKERVESMKIGYEIKGDKRIFLEDGKPSGVPQTIRLDPGRSPKEIDTTPTEGVNKGKVYKGIYLLDGDTLKVRWGREDLPRPTSLDPNKDPVKCDVTTLKRLKK